MNINQATKITDEEVAEVFAYHPWSKEQEENGCKVREALGRAFATIIMYVPPCPDRTTALRKIREARMDANSAITHRGKF